MRFKWSAVLMLALVSAGCYPDHITNVKADVTVGGGGTGTCSVNGVPCTPTPTACPSGFSTCNGPRFSDAGLTPQDTTYKISNKRFIKGLVYIPSGMSTNLLIRSLLGCEASSSTPQVIATTVANIYTVSIEMQGIATCSDSTVVKLAADSTVRKSVHVTVVSAQGSISIIQPPTIGPTGVVGQYGCLNTYTDRRCWYYSTQPLSASVVQKDTTFTVNTFPWSAGFNPAGRYKNLNVGTGHMCVFVPSQPEYADCKVHTVAASVSGSSLRAEAVLQEWPVPEVLRNLKP